MHIINKILKAAADIFLKKKIQLGTDTYMRRLLLPNLLFGSLKHEEYLDDIYSAVLKKTKGAIIDVGVNTGQTLLKILSIDNNRRYYGFDPQGATAACVEFFLIENKISNCSIFPIALSDFNGCIPIYIRGDGVHSMASPVASIVGGFRPTKFYNHTKHIYAARGDEVIDSLGITSIALIKIDVEGAELEVVRGLIATIEKYRPLILFEVLHHYLSVTKEELDKKTIDFREARIRELEEIIRLKRYHVYQINGQKELIKIAKIKPKFVNELESTDYIAVPEEKESGFRISLEASRRIIMG